MPRPFLIISQSDNLIQNIDEKFIYWMTNKSDSNQLASELTLFAKIEHIRVQQDKV